MVDLKCFKSVFYRVKWGVLSMLLGVTPLAGINLISNSISYHFSKWTIALGVFLGCSLVFTAPLLATAKTMPQGVWRFTSGLMSTTLDKYSVETYIVDTFGQGVGQGDFKLVPLDQFTLDHTGTISLIQGGFVPSGVPIIKRYEVSEFNFNVMYGLTDQVTLMAFVPLVNRNRENDQSLVDAMTKIDEMAGGGMLGPTTAEDIIIPPLRSSGSGLGDITVGATWGPHPNLSVFGLMRSGLLKTGRDYSEVSPDEDGFSEEPTGGKEDVYTLGLNYDLNLGFNVLQLTAASIITTPGLDRSFVDGTVIDVDKGMMLSFGGQMNFQATPMLTIETKLNYLVSQTDKIKGGSGTWQTVENSGVSALLAELNIKFMPLPFVTFWSSIGHTIDSEATGGINEFPGRLETADILKFGVSLFYK